MKTNFENNLSYIDNIGELRKEISTVKARVKLQETDLNDRLNRLPREAIKATVSKAVPSFVSSFLPGKSIGIVTSLLGIILNKGNFEKGGWKNRAVEVASQVSIYTVLKGAYTFWQKRKNAAKKNPG